MLLSGSSHTQKSALHRKKNIWKGNSNRNKINLDENFSREHKLEAPPPKFCCRAFQSSLLSGNSFQLTIRSDTWQTTAPANFSISPAIPRTNFLALLITFARVAHTQQPIELAERERYSGIESVVKTQKDERPSCSCEVPRFSAAAGGNIKISAHTARIRPTERARARMCVCLSIMGHAPSGWNATKARGEDVIQARAVSLLLSPLFGPRRRRRL